MSKSMKEFQPGILFCDASPQLANSPGRHGTLVPALHEPGKTPLTLLKAHLSQITRANSRLLRDGARCSRGGAADPCRGPTQEHRRCLPPHCVRCASVFRGQGKGLTTSRRSAGPRRRAGGEQLAGEVDWDRSSAFRVGVARRQAEAGRPKPSGDCPTGDSRRHTRHGTPSSACPMACRGRSRWPSRDGRDRGRPAHNRHPPSVRPQPDGGHARSVAHAWA